MSRYYDDVYDDDDFDDDEFDEGAEQSDPTDERVELGRRLFLLRLWSRTSFVHLRRYGFCAHHICDWERGTLDMRVRTLIRYLQDGYGLSLAQFFTIAPYLDAAIDQQPQPRDCRKNRLRHRPMPKRKIRKPGDYHDD